MLRFPPPLGRPSPRSPTTSCLAQTRQLARHEQALQILVLDHLREIEGRGLHLTRGYGSLFDYVVHELGYTAAAAWRRIKAMRLCDQTDGARELLQDGKLNLSNAAQLQNLFERSDRNHGRPAGSHGTGGGLDGAPPRSDGGAGEPAPAAPMRADGSDRAPAAVPVLDAAAREELVKQAAGKSTREVQQMVAEVDPELARANDRVRALGGGRWELKATIDAECRHGLEKLQMLLSHTDPHLTLGGLVARLVRDGLDRHDPARPPRARRSRGRNSANGGRSASESARHEQDAVPPNVASAKGGAVELRSEIEADDVSGAAVRGGATYPSAAKWDTEAEHGGAKSSVVGELVRHSDEAPKRVGQDAHVEAAERLRGVAASAPGRRHDAEPPCRQPRATRGNGGRAASPAKRHGRAAGDGRGDGKGGVPGPANCAAEPHLESGERSAARASLRRRHRFTSASATRLAYAAGHGAAAPAERSPALERHLAALSCFGSWPGSRSRYIPAAVRREVWRRDQGCCSYVDRHSGRRCGSRYRLEIDHVVPFALGGGAEPGNLRLRCEAHHKFRHAQRPAHRASVPTDARRAPGSGSVPPSAWVPSGRMRQPTGPRRDRAAVETCAHVCPRSM